MKMNAVFHCKQSEFDLKACIVDKIVELDYREYDAFRNNMLRDQPFIAEFNSALRPSGDGTLRYLLVLGEGSDDGTLVDSQESSYARHAAFVPGARQLIAMDQLKAEQTFKEQMAGIEGIELDKAQGWMYHARALAEADAGTFGAAVHQDYLRRLQEFGGIFRKLDRMYEETPAEIFNYKAGYMPEELLPVAHWIHNGGGAEDAYIQETGFFQPMKYAAVFIMSDWFSTKEGEVFTHKFSEVQEDFGLKAAQIPKLIANLRGHEELAGLELDEENNLFRVTFKPCTLGQAAASQPLEQKDLDVMQARHTLWTLDQPDGGRADFSSQTLAGLDFYEKDFSGAAFIGASIQQCNFSEGYFNECDFSGAKLQGVTANEVLFHCADFSDTSFNDCDFTCANFMDSAFTGAQIYDSNFEGAHLEGADFTRADISDCEGLDDISQGQAMAMGG